MKAIRVKSRLNDDVDDRVTGDELVRFSLSELSKIRCKEQGNVKIKLKARRNVTFARISIYRVSLQSLLFVASKKRT